MIIVNSYNSIEDICRERTASLAIQARSMIIDGTKIGLFYDFYKYFLIFLYPFEKNLILINELVSFKPKKDSKLTYFLTRNIANYH